MTIVEGIRELLYTHDCVIVPGFGGVIGHYRTAQIHPVKGDFSAPSKHLAFNQQLVKNDGLLVTELAESNGYSVEESFQKIEEFVLSQKQQMRVKTTVVWEGIGAFSFNAEGKIQFKEQQEENYLEDSFGLSDLYFKPVEREEKTEDMQQVQSSSPQKRPVPPRRPAKKKEEEPAKKDSSKLVFLLIPIVLVVGLAAFMFIKKDSQGDPLMASLIPSLKSSTIEETDGEIEDDEILAADAAEETSEDDESYDSESHDDDWGHDESHDAAAAVSSSNGTYHIIAGVFSRRGNAKKLADQHHGEILEIDGYYKVSVGRYDSKDEADQEKAHLENELGNDIWVLAE